MNDTRERDTLENCLPFVSPRLTACLYIYIYIYVAAIDSDVISAIAVEFLRVYTYTARPIMDTLSINTELQKNISIKEHDIYYALESGISLFRVTRILYT